MKSFNETRSHHIVLTFPRDTIMRFVNKSRFCLRWPVFPADMDDDKWIRPNSTNMLADLKPLLQNNPDNVLVCHDISKSEYYGNVAHQHRIVNCPKPRSIRFGNFSFGDYHMFELNQLSSRVDRDGLVLFLLGARLLADRLAFLIESIPDLPQLQSILLSESASGRHLLQ